MGGVDQELKSKARDKMITGRGRMVIHMPFFATLAVNLTLNVTDRVEKAFTDGIMLNVNPDFVMQQSDENITLLWAEAALKCGLKLPCRMGYRESKLWNKAATFAVAQYLKSEFHLPDGFPIRSDLFDKNCEEIYTVLLSEQQEQDEGQQGGDQPGEGQPGSGSGGGKCDVDRPSGDQSKNNRDDWSDDNDGQRPEPENNRGVTDEQIGNEWDPVFRNAAKTCQGIGRSPAWLNELLDSERHAQIDWRAKLREYVELCARDNYTWARLNRRYLSSGTYLPSLYSERLPTMAIMGDVSGSVGDDQWKYFLGEFNEILRDFDVEIHFYQFDSEPKGDADIYTQENLPVVMTRKGCGGTNPCTTFAKIEKDDIAPACIIVFSDMYVDSFPDVPPDVPVLWVSSTKIKNIPDYGIPPFGELCELTMD